MQPVAQAVAVAGMGFQGDVSHGREKRQVLLIENETLQEFRLEPGIVRENMTVSGVALAGLPAGTRLQAGEVIFEVTMDCAPCELIEALRPGLQAAMEGRRGTLVKVVEGGQVRVGDEIAVLQAEPA